MRASGASSSASSSRRAGARLADNGYRRWPQVKSHHPLARHIFGFLHGMSFEKKLDRVHKAPAVGTLRLGG